MTINKYDTTKDGDKIDQMHISSTISSSYSVDFVITGFGSGKSLIKQSVRLNPGSTILEFETLVDWHEAHKLLKVEFPLAGSTTRIITIYTV